MPVRRLLVVLMFLCAWPFAAVAAGEEPSMVDQVDDAFVKQISDLVVDNIQLGDCGEVKCTPATALEKLDGMLPKEMTRIVIERAAGSAFAEFCGKDWTRRSFASLLTREQLSGCWSERQLAAIEVTHSLALLFYRKSLPNELQSCSAELDAHVESYLTELRKVAKRRECPRW